MFIQPNVGQLSNLLRVLTHPCVLQRMSNGGMTYLYATKNAPKNGDQNREILGATSSPSKGESHWKYKFIWLWGCQLLVVKQRQGNLPIDLSFYIYIYISLYGVHIYIYLILSLSISIHLYPSLSIYTSIHVSMY